LGVMVRTTSIWVKRQSVATEPSPTLVDCHQNKCMGFQVWQILLQSAFSRREIVSYLVDGLGLRSQLTLCITTAGAGKD